MNEAEIRRNLKSTFIGKRITCYESVASTNDIAKEIIRTAEEGTVIVADEQTSGRGRLGRKWISAKGESLILSVILRPDIPPSYMGIISLAAGLAAAETIGEFIGISPECKWPNDVFVMGKKCCGILSEASFDGDRCAGVIVGIGMNVNQTSFPEELSPIAISLRQAGNQCFPLEMVLATLLLNLERRYILVQSHRYDEIRQGWLHFARIIGKEVTITQANSSIRGVARRIEDNGELVLLCDGVEKRFASGDVTQQD